MLRISKTRVKEVAAITLVLSTALFINDVILSKPTAPQIQPVEVPDTKMVVPVVKKEPLKKLTKKPSEVECLAAVIYNEARGESTKAQLAVGQVVLNRAQSRYFPNNICKVAFQPKQFTGLRRIKYNKETFANAKKVMKGTAKWITDATHFHTPAVNPKWASSPNMEPRGQIGGHLFYKMG